CVEYVTGGVPIGRACRRLHRKIKMGGASDTTDFRRSCWASPSSCVPSGGVARWPKLTVRHSTKWRKGALSRAVLPHHLTPFTIGGSSEVRSRFRNQSDRSSR